MLRPSTARRFSVHLLLVYGLLITPWPGLKSGYGSLFRTGGNASLHTFGFSGLVELRPPAREHAAWDVEMFMRKPGDSRQWHMEYSSRGWGYLPTAAVVALILATPLGRSRRWIALAVGLVLVHIFIALRIAAAVVYGMCWGGAIRLSAVEAKASEVALHGFSNSPATTFVVPIVIWLLLTFRRSNLDAILQNCERASRP